MDTNDPRRGSGDFKEGDSLPPPSQEKPTEFSPEPPLPDSPMATCGQDDPADFDSVLDRDNPLDYEPDDGDEGVGDART